MERKSKRSNTKNLVLIAAVVIGYVVIMNQRRDFSVASKAVLESKPHYMVMGMLFSFLTFFTAALSYKSLVLQPIRYSRMSLIQLASSFADKLAPAGAGGLAVNTQYLTKNNLSYTQAGSIAGINNLMGVVAHTSLLLAVVIFGKTTIREAFQFRVSVPSWLWPTIVVGLIVTAIVLIKRRHYRAKLIGVLKGVRNTLKGYRQHPWRLAGSYGAAVLTTLSFVVVLYISALAVGSHITLLQTLVVFTVGVVAASVTPTPGGIGGAEAGLATALSGAGLTPPQALTVALLFRFLTYWLPLLPGFLAFQYVTKKEYI